MTEVCVGRAAPDAARTASLLRRHGIPARGVSLLRRVPSATPSWAAHRGEVDVIVPTPTAAVLLNPEWLPSGARWLATEPRTAAILRRRGIAVSASGDRGAADLAGRARPEALLLVCTSDRGGAEVLRVRPDARVIPLYGLLPSERLPRFARSAQVWLLASPSAVDALVALAPNALETAKLVLALGDTTGRRVVERAGRSTAEVRPAHLVADVRKHLGSST